MKVVFESESNILREILFKKSESLAASLDIVGRPLIVHNILKIVEAKGGVELITIPSGLPETASLLHKAFPEVELLESETPRADQSDSIKVPMDSLALIGADGGLRFERLLYPWDLLKNLQEMLSSEIPRSFIAEDATVSETAVLVDPVYVGKGAHIDDFCKVRGPIYVAAGATVGTGSLVRNSSIGAKSNVGFNCEISKSFLIGEDVIPHLCLMLDSALGQDVWMGGFIGTINALFTLRNIRCLVDGQLIDSGLVHMGMLAGHSVRIGAACMTLPGRYLPPGTVTQVNSVFSDSGDIVKSSRIAEPLVKAPAKS